MSAFPDGDNLFNWMAKIVGGSGTVYEGLSYKLSFSFPSHYPYVPPTVKFVTPCYHPNVDSHGNICLDILKEKWSALYDVRTILLSIQSLLAEPNNDSPLNVEAADLWINQKGGHAMLVWHHCVCVCVCVRGNEARKLATISPGVIAWNCSCCEVSQKNSFSFPFHYMVEWLIDLCASKCTTSCVEVWCRIVGSIVIQVEVWYSW